MESTILIIEDETKFRELLTRIIEVEGFEVLQAQSARVGLNMLLKNDIRVVISDVKLPDANGVELVKQIKDTYPHIEVINLTAFGSIKDSVKAIKNGAFDYIMKGDDNDRIIPIINKAVEQANLNVYRKNLKKTFHSTLGFTSILGKSSSLADAIDLAKQVTQTSTTVLLLGETGTGKEVFAHAIHQESDRAGQPFIAVNCSAFSTELLHSELFGYVAGAFTGAIKETKGLFEAADGGTLFLDEIGDMNIDLQARLLRVLEDGSFNKVGDTKPTRVNTRIIAATNKDLFTEAIENRFRLDLYYRLSIFTIKLPPLRERKEDIEPLTNYFNREFSVRLNRKEKSIDPGFLQSLMNHHWNGNIRELRNVIERAIIISKGDALTSDLLPLEIKTPAFNRTETGLDLAKIESQYISKALKQSQGNKSEAARLLGISLSTLYRKIEEYKN